MIAQQPLPRVWRAGGPRSRRPHLIERKKVLEVQPGGEGQMQAESQEWYDAATLTGSSVMNHD